MDQDTSTKSTNISHVSSGCVFGAVSVLSPGIMDRTISVLRFIQGGDKSIDEELNILRFNEYYRFYDVWVNPKDLALYIDDPTCLVVNLNLSSLVYWYRFFSLTELKLLCRSHGIKHGQRTKLVLAKDMRDHECSDRCAGLVYVFKSLPRPRRHVSRFFGDDDTKFQFSYIPPTPREKLVNDDQSNVLPSASVKECALLSGQEGVAVTEDIVESDYDHLKPVDKGKKESIIREWQDDMNTVSQALVVCASCSIRVAVNGSVYVHSGTVDFTLLRNDYLPREVLPNRYDFELYGRAILNYKGLEKLEDLGMIRLCNPCHSSLSSSSVPRFSLCNWLYYGHDNLPHDACEAFKNASVFEKMLVCRARANTITCRFNSRGDGNDENKPDSTLNRARKGVRGNVLVAPLDVLRMNCVIPPCSNTIRDTMCAVFIGKMVPTRVTLQYYSPILVRKSRVKKMIEFLLSYNIHYKPSDDFQYSEVNLESLFSEDDEDELPRGVHIGYMEGNDAIESTVADYTPRKEDGGGKGEEYDELLMENVGYTEGDHSPMAYLSMKALALERCLQGKPFIASGTGSQAVPDFKNPSILTWLFPHLDPWGIGGFYHPGRMVKISMFDQLCHLLKVDESPFQRDTEFAFVFHNVCRKAMVAQSLRFSVSRGVYRKVALDLLRIDPDTLARLNEECRKDPYYRPQGEQEKSIFKTLANIRTVSKHLPGSDGYKVMMRNEIRALINYHGTPTLFVTINPSDVDHPLVRLLGGEEVTLDDVKGEEVSKWQRSLFAAKHPLACAQFFDVMITRFIKIILRYGRDQEGLYGRCTGYYGTVEAQGKGTLHCHMLIWLRGHLSPQDLKLAMSASETYRKKVLIWMESVISCEFPGSLGVEQQAKDFPCRVLPKDTGDPHPGAILAPFVSRYTSMTDFWRDFDCFLNRVLFQFSWHEHQATCWKYLERGQTKTDNNCRMGMDGITREESQFDEQSTEILLKRHHPKIAQYTDVVSYLMQCNMDVKHVGSGEAAKSFLYYVTDYITKASLSVHVGMSALSYAVKKIYTKIPNCSTTLSDDDAKGAVITAVNSMMGRQEISQPQVMSYLTGGGDHYKSHKFVTMQWGLIKKIVDAQCNESEDRGIIHSSSSNLGPDNLPENTDSATVSLTLGCKTITASSQYLDYVFRSRDPRFNDLCLYDFVSWVSKSTFGKSTDRSIRELSGAFVDPAHPQCSTHYLSLRRSCYVPVILGPSIPNPERSDTMKEDWSKDMLILFKPWRCIDDLKGAYTTWNDAFMGFEGSLTPFHRRIMKNMKVLTECSEARDRHRTRVRGNTTMDNDPGTSIDGAMMLDETGDNNPAADYLDRDLDCFRAMDPHENGFGSTAEGILDDHSSRLLNMCLPLKMEDITRRQPESMSVEPSIVYEDDAPKLAQHQAIMKLKRPRHCIEDIEEEIDPQQTAVQRVGNGPIADRVTVRLDYHQRDSKKDMERAIADGIVSEFGLADNDRQLKAFRIVACQLIDMRADQLLLHVAGVGGTGKSHVIKAIVRLFEALSKRHELLLGAPTGIAAVLIKGQTLHSLANLTPNGKRTNIAQLVSVWKHVKYLIVDEVSMIGARFLSQLSNRMRQGKGDDPIGRERPFGGVNVIFMGDFGQLKPPKQYALYANELVENPSFAEGRNEKGIGALDGVFLWRQVQNVVELVKNQRQSDDPVYAAFLNRLRVGECLTDNGHGGSDLEYLRTRLLENQGKNLPVLESFRDAPIIVGSKSLRDFLNMRLLRYHATRTGKEPVLYYSSDFMSRSVVDRRVRDRLWSLPSTVNREAFGRLPLFVGMRVMITENLAFGDGIVNGCEGVVKDIKYDEDVSGRRCAKVVYVHIPGCGIMIDDLGLDIVPIFPVISRIEHGLSDPRFKTKTFSRRQVPLVPAYAYTDYKSQGRTLERVIVDLATARGQGVYVMLSRVKSLSGLLILRWFPPNKIYHRLSEELRTELVRIHDIACNTTDL